MYSLTISWTEAMGVNEHTSLHIVATATALDSEAMASAQQNDKKLHTLLEQQSSLQL